MHGQGEVSGHPSGDWAPRAQATLTPNEKAAEPSAPFPPRYTELELILRTRLSVTWKGLDQETETEVVLKEPTAEVFLTPDGLDQFRQEVRIAARLVHANIVPIRETALEEYPYYFTMPFIEGVHLDDFCRQRALNSTDRLRLLLKICRAVAYAHEQGVVHRDLKPNNILVSNGGEPQILDFGLGRFVDARHEAGALEPDKVMGALGYMAPEQASGLSGSTRTDVYGLGVILFELLTGRRPIEPAKGDLEESLRRIREDQPPRPRAIAPSLSPELDSVILKAIEKEPERRYASVNDLADDLEAILAGRAPKGVRTARPRRFTLWVRRNRVPVAVAAAVLVGAIAFTVYTVTEAFRNQAALDRARSAELVAAARWGIWRDEPERAGRILWQEHLEHPSLRTRFALWEFYRRYPCLLGIPCGRVVDVEYSAGGTWLLSVAAGGGLYIHDASTGRLNASLAAQNARARCAKFSPDGSRLYVGGDDGRIRVFAFHEQTGRLEAPVTVLEDAVGPVNCVAVSPDGRWLAGGTGRSERVGPEDIPVDAGAWLWKLGVTGEIASARKLEGQRGIVTSIAFSPDSTTLATGTLRIHQEGVVRVWDVESGRLQTASRPGVHRRAVRFAPDGMSLFVEGSGLSQWIPETGEERRLESASGWGVRSIDVTTWNERCLVASASGDGRVRFYDLLSNTELPVQGYHDAVANHVDVTFSPSGDATASAGPDGVKVWEVPSPQMIRLEPCSEESRYVGFAASSGVLVALFHDRPHGFTDLALWRPQGPAGQPLPAVPTAAASIAVTSNGKRIALSTSSDRFTSSLVFAELDGVHRFTLPLRPPIPGGCAMHWHRCDANVLFLCCNDGVLRLVRLNSETSASTAPLEEVHDFGSDCTCVAQDATGEWLAACSEGRSGQPGQVRLWSSTGRPLSQHSFDEAYRDEAKFLVRDFTHRVALLRDADGRLIVATIDGNEKDVALWTSTGQRSGSLYGHRECIRQCQALNDHMLVTASDDGTVRVWDVWEETELCILCEYPSQHRPTISVRDGCIAIGHRHGVSIADTRDIERFIEGHRAYGHERLARPAGIGR